MDVVNLRAFDFAQAAAKAGLRTEGTRVLGRTQGLAELGPGVAPAQAAHGFAGALTQALQGVSQAQTDASRMQREFQLGNSTVSLEETMVAMQKAQLGFTAAVQVRNRLVQAYSDIMNMQV